MKLTKILLVVTLVLAAVLTFASCGNNCEHVYDEAITQAPTCVAEGVKTFSCSLCGDSYTEAIPMVDHEYETVSDRPTCTKPGTKTYICKVCDYSYSEEIEPAAGHKYTERITEPTCSEGGYTTFTCKCGDSYTGNETEPTGVHTYNTIVIPLTEEQQAQYPDAVGIRTKACSGCNAVGEGADAASLVLLNMDFETKETTLLDYVNSLSGITPYSRGEDNTRRGLITDGYWYNSSNAQVLFDEQLGLDKKDTFTISMDAIFGSTPSKDDYIVSWGASSSSSVAAYRFNLRINAEGKMEIQSNFKACPEQDGQLANYTFDFESWYHLDIVVDVKNSEVTIWAGKWADESRTALADYKLVGQTDGMYFKSMDGLNNSCFRIAHKKGIIAMDNFVITVPMP